MQSLITQIVDEQGQVTASRVRFDFSRLGFIDPTGVVVLCNLVDYLKKLGVTVNARVKKPYSGCVEYLDDFGFFQHYSGKSLRPSAKISKSTMPVERVQSPRIYTYLNDRLMPWIADRVGLEQESVATVRTCIEEIFHNIDDHSEVKVGSVFAQYFPSREHIHVAISDYGPGIPNVVRGKLPGLTDTQALRKACEEGFTTQSNVRNRGAGLPTLISYVTLRNKGSVLIASGRAELAATNQNGVTDLRPRRIRQGLYPGTLVRVILRTDTFEAMAQDIQPEQFKW